MMILVLDTEFTDISPDMELLSLALVSMDGAHEFYGERTDVPAERCSRFVREAVLPQMTAQAPISGDIDNLRTRLRAFVDGLPDVARVACDSFYDIEMLSWALGSPWPEKLDSSHLRLGKYLASPTFSESQHRYHSRCSYHHALNDARGLREGLLAWNSRFDR